MTRCHLREGSEGGGSSGDRGWGATGMRTGCQEGDASDRGAEVAGTDERLKEQSDASVAPIFVGKVVCRRVWYSFPKVVWLQRVRLLFSARRVKLFVHSALWSC